MNIFSNKKAFTLAETCDSQCGTSPDEGRSEQLMAAVAEPKSSRQRRSGAIFDCTGGKKAFTLAETLIVLAIIGVITAITIPSVVAHYKEKQIVTSLKKNFSILNNALQLTIVENGDITTWSLAQNAKGVTDILVPHLNVMEYCGTKKGCWTKGSMKKLKGDIWPSVPNGDVYNLENPDFSKFTLTDGTHVLIRTSNPICNISLTNNKENKFLNNICFHIFVNIDSRKKENTIGKDVFLMRASANGSIFPAGTPDDTGEPIGNCNFSCYGWGCAAWVMNKENMDYLHGKKICWGENLCNDTGSRCGY